ncbi:hypothetical protein HMPREF9574_01129 [Cutibacterium acnes HL074PA1]|nr:hypothetical protein HMPREF9574_01129 [Cutibacterium acnes HL074PA1]
MTRYKREWFPQGPSSSRSARVMARQMSRLIPAPPDAMASISVVWGTLTPLMSSRTATMHIATRTNPTFVVGLGGAAGSMGSGSSISSASRGGSCGIWAGARWAGKPFGRGRPGAVTTSPNSRAMSASKAASTSLPSCSISLHPLGNSRCR